MIVGERVAERMSALGLSQSELARRVGVAQPTIYKLLKSNKLGSKFLHRIARELGTTPAYLEGETDDPLKDAPPPPPPATARIVMEVVLPPERALARMFEVLLSGLDREASVAEQALLLARRLPIGLSQLRDLAPEPLRAPAEIQAPEEAPGAPAMLHHEPTR